MPEKPRGYARSLTIALLHVALLQSLSEFTHGIHAARARRAVAAGALRRCLGLPSCLRRICHIRTHGARRPCTGMCTHGQSWDARAGERPSPRHPLARAHTPLSVSAARSQPPGFRPASAAPYLTAAKMSTRACVHPDVSRDGRTHCAGTRTTTGRTAARSRAQRR